MMSQLMHHEPTAQRLPGIESLIRTIPHPGGDPVLLSLSQTHHYPQHADFSRPSPRTMMANIQPGHTMPARIRTNFGGAYIGPDQPSPTLTNSSDNFSGNERFQRMSLGGHGMVLGTRRQLKQVQKKLAIRGGPKGVGRGRKEKNARDDQGCVLQATEDVMENYLDWSHDVGLKAPLTGANATGSGLNAPKIVVLTGSLGLVTYCLHKELCQAIREDRVEAFQHEMRGVINNSVAAWHDDRTLFRGTFLDPEPSDVPCSHADKLDPCTVHVDAATGHAKPHRQCRKDIHSGAFSRRLIEYTKKLASLGHFKN